MAVPSDEHERTLAFAEIALQQIRALRQPALPRNFEIWYHYATGYNPDLNDAINETLAQKGTLDDADIEQIYDDLSFAEAASSDRIETVGTRMLDEIKQVLDMIDAAAGSATSYSASLADASEKLQGDHDGATLARHHRAAGRQAPRRWRSATRSSKRGCRRRDRRSNSCSKISRRCGPRASPIR